MSFNPTIRVTNGINTYVSTVENFTQLSRKMKRDLIRDFLAAFEDAAINAKQWIIENWIPLIAKDRDLMRVGFENAIETNQFIDADLDFAQVEFLINLTRFIDDVESPITGEEYAKYHIVQHPEFKFPQGYFRPTEPGTSPINLRVFEDVKLLMAAFMDDGLLMRGYNLE